MSELTRYDFDPGRADELGAMIQPARAVHIEGGTATVAGIVLDVPGDLAPGTYTIDQLLLAAGAKAAHAEVCLVDHGPAFSSAGTIADHEAALEVAKIRQGNRWDERLPEVRDWRRRQGGR